MIFKRIRLENLFAYNGIQEIDLEGCGAKRNIVLISGRNGTGKTSFINAVKLLFLGANELRLRRVGFPPTALSPNHYVRGVAGVWSGLINTQARRSGSDRASISIVWEEESGIEIEARRSWRLNGPSYDEKIEILKNGEVPISDNEISLQLAEKLPRDFVPFFFFDGEQIRELAEADDAIAANEIERILNLSFVGEVEQGVSEFVRQRRREALPEETQVRIRRAEGNLATKQAEEIASEKRLGILQDSIQEDESRKRQLASERDELRTGVSDADRRLLEQRLETEESQRSDLARNICETLPPEAPFLANLELTLQAYGDVETVVSALGAWDMEGLATIRRELPDRLLDQEPHPEIPLHQLQIVHLRRKLLSLLSEYATAETPDQIPSYLRTVDVARAKSLRDRYLIWVRDGARRRNEIAKELKQVIRLTAKAEQTAEALAKVSVASEGNLRRFQEISKELERLDYELAGKYEDVGKLEAGISQCKSNISETKDQIAILEQEHEQARTTSEIVQFARHVEAVLREYRARQRELRRTSVEKRINSKLNILLAEHGQIGRVKLSKQFIMTYYNNHDEKIGRASISAGMKQLVATALLWALKEESGKRIPLVIDTPFARIDRRNRARLLESYYPNVGEQVIVLPTDSEIDDTQLMYLAPYIAKKYRIENIDGENATFILEEKNV